MAQLPVLRLRRKQPNTAEAALARAVALLTAAKLSLRGIRAAKKGANAYDTAKTVGRRVAVPVVVAGGGVVVWRIAHKGSSTNGDSADAGRPLGPVATADTVSPPVDAAVQAAGQETS